MSQRLLAKNVPPGATRAFRSVLFLFQDSQVICRMAAAFGKRNDVIEFMRSAIESSSGFALPLFDFFSAYRFWNSATTCRSHHVNHNYNECGDDPSGSLVSRISAGKEIGNESEHASEKKIPQIVGRILSSPVNAEQQDKRSHYRDQENSCLLLSKDRLGRRGWRGRNRGIDLRGLPPKGKFGSTLVSPSGLGYVNAAMLAFA